MGAPTTLNPSAGRVEGTPVRRTTALKVLIGIFVVLVPAMLLVEGRQAAREVLAAGLLIGLFVAAVLLRKRGRSDLMELEARRMGLEFAARDPFGLLDEPFALLDHGYAELGNVLWGPWRNLEVRLFDYVFTKSEHHEERFSCALVAIPGGWPTMVIRPERLRLGDALAPSVVEFELDEFNRAFDVRSEDRRFASAVVDQRMMEWLLGLGDGWGFEIRGRWILGSRDQVQPWELEGMLRTLGDFVDRIPRAARSLYPETLPARPDRIG
jgi:hypothetical protein